MCFPQRASQKEQNKIAKILSVHTVHKTRRSQSKATQPRPILPKKLQTFICKYSPQKAGEGEDRRKTRKSQCKALQPCFIMTMCGLRVLAQDHPRWKKKKKITNLIAVMPQLQPNRLWFVQDNPGCCSILYAACPPRRYRRRNFSHTRVTRSL